jgi:hypothetical protein
MIASQHLRGIPSGFGEPSFLSIAVRGSAEVKVKIASSVSVKQEQYIRTRQEPNKLE